MAIADIPQEELSSIYSIKDEDSAIQFLRSKTHLEVFRLVLSLQDLLRSGQISNDSQRESIYMVYRRGSFILEKRHQDAFRQKKILDKQKANPPS